MSGGLCPGDFVSVFGVSVRGSLSLSLRSLFGGLYVTETPIVHVVAATGAVEGNLLECILVFLLILVLILKYLQRYYSNSLVTSWYRSNSPRFHTQFVELLRTYTSPGLP